MARRRTTSRPTIQDVANAAEVSKGLVSLAFKDPSRVSDVRRERILRAAEELGYQPNFLARSLAAERSSFIGILLGNLRNPLFPEIADAARLEFENAGWHSLLTSATLPGSTEASRADPRMIQMFQDLRPSAVLVIGTLAEDSPLPPGTPTVYASSIPPLDAEGSSVRVDDSAGVSLAVEHLASRGRKHIAFAGGEGGLVSQHRLEAYREAITARDAEPLVLPAELTEQSGFDALRRALAEGHRPDAVVAANDLAAIGVQSAADQAGLAVPEDLAVTGFDNIFLAGLHRISITSVDPKNTRVGSQAARLLLAEMAEPRPPEVTLVPPELVVRGSTSR